MLLIGDVHGMFKSYIKLLIHERPDFSIVLGDFGIGYGYDKGLVELVNTIPGQHKYLRGNHDSPKASKTNPMYMGDYGSQGSMFWISGCSTPSWAGKDWIEEELSYQKLEQIKADYLKKKPKLVLSHTAPFEIGEIVMNRRSERDRTSFCMQMMWEEYQPELWVFGHFHQSKNFEINGTNFICLDSLETLRVDDNYLY